MAPDGTVLVATDALPDLPAGIDVVAGVQHLAAFADHLLRNRRSGLVQIAPHPQHDAEAHDQQGTKPQP